MSDLVERYLACWNEKDPAARRSLINQVWSADATYTDPLADAQGGAAIEATIAAVQGQFPDFVFSPVGVADTHHRHARFRWGLGPAGADPVVVGFDVVTLTEGGEIASVVGFLDQVPG